MLFFQIIGHIFARLTGRTNEPLINKQHQQQVDEDNWNPDLEKAFEITINIGLIVFVEMTLKWNNIKGVHSITDPGQFMPLMIAIAQLLAVIYQAISRFAHMAASENDLHIEGEFFPSSFAADESTLAVFSGPLSQARTSARCRC